MKRRLGWLAVLGILMQLLVGCDALFNGNLKQTLEEDFSSTYTFFSDDPNDNKNASNLILTYKIGTVKTASEFPVFLRPGYHIVGWSFLKNPSTLSTECPDSVHVDENGYIISFTVTPQPADLLAMWKAGDPEPEVDPGKKYVKVTYIGREGIDLGTRTVEVGTPPGQPGFEQTDGKYSFYGWYYDAECQNPFDVYKTPVTEDITLYSKWIVLRSITFHKNFGTDETVTRQVSDGDDYSMPSYDSLFSDTPEDMFFVGWAFAPDAKEKDYSAGDTVSAVSKDMTFYAVWTSSYCTVTFIGRDGVTVLNKQKVEPGERPQRFDMKYSDGDYSFSGWYKDSELTEWIDIFGTEITEDITVYSRWGIYCNIVFYKNDGSTECQTLGYEKGSVFSLPDYMLSERTDGYYFLGWATSANATEPEYFMSDNYGTLTEPLTFYAVWATESCSITIINSCKRAEKIQKRVAKGSKISISEIYWRETNYGQKEFTAPGAEYNRAGFGATADATKIDEELWNTFIITENKTCYVLWTMTIVGHFGYYHENMPTEEVKNLYTYFYGTPITDPTEKYSKPWRLHYDFTHWYTDRECTALVDFNNLPAVSEEDHYIHIYAGWEVAKYTVRFFDSNGREIDTIATQKVEYGSTATKPADPVEENRVFKGWYTNMLWKEEYDFSKPVEENLNLFAKMDPAPVPSPSVSVTMPEYSDITVTKSQSGATVTFTAETGCTNYEWTVDGEWASNVSGVTVTGNVLTVDTTGWAKGSYDIVLKVQKSDGTTYSFWAQVEVK